MRPSVGEARLAIGALRTLAAEGLGPAELSVGPAEAIAEAARGFGQDDDITVLTLVFLGEGVSIA